MYKHVGEESPYLDPSMWIVNKNGEKRCSR